MSMYGVTPPTGDAGGSGYPHKPPLLTRVASTQLVTEADLAGGLDEERVSVITAYVPSGRTMTFRQIAAKILDLPFDTPAENLVQILLHMGHTILSYELGLLVALQESGEEAGIWLPGANIAFVEVEDGVIEVAYERRDIDVRSTNFYPFTSEYSVGIAIVLVRNLDCESL